MSTTLERLRRLHSLRPKRTQPEPELPPTAAPASFHVRGPIEEVVPGTEIENSGGRCYVAVTRYPVETRRGRATLSDVLACTPAAIAPLYPVAGLDDRFDFRRVAFLDTETSGLGGGAGVYAFMVGVGAFETTSFVVRQFFMRHPGEETAVLTAVAQLFARYDGVVTFNGRSFDVPLLRGRYGYARTLLPEGITAPSSLKTTAPHLDLLPPARRLWKRRLTSCALGSLEQNVLGHTRTQEDVPGRFIPYLYTHYLRTGEAGELRRVFYHNREDIVSMVALAELLCRHYADPLAAAARGELEAMDLLSLGRIHIAMGRVETATQLFHQALDRFHDAALLAEVFAALGWLLKRQERWDEATALWQRWLSTVPGPDPRPYVELAKFHEWRSGDLEQAALWTGWAIHNQETAPAHQRSPRAMAELRHRLHRLQTKIERRATTTREPSGHATIAE